MPAPKIPKKWTAEKKLELYGMYERGMTRKQIADHYGISYSRAGQLVYETRDLLDSGYLGRDGSSKALPTSEPKFDLRAQLAEMGYDPATGIIEYRKILQGLIKRYVDDVEVKSVRSGGHDRLTTRIATAGDGNAKDGLDDLRGQLMDLWREAVDLDKAMMPYVHPKLQSNSVKVEQERPPLLIIEHPGGK